jgi:hypothetical protein
MKTWILTIVAAGVIGLAAFTLTRRSTAPAVLPVPSEAPAEAKEEMPAKPAGFLPSKTARPKVEPLVSSPASAAVTAPLPEPLPDENAVFRRTIDTLLSPKATYAEKWAIWKTLREEGRLGDAIDELKQRKTGDPESAPTASNLGVAFLLNAGTTKDAREQGINGLSADRSFDDALKLDPQNWEAQYWKAYGMTHWPAEMNKAPEVLERLTNLLKQQETQPAQPHYAQTYQLLGDQYQKAGYTTEARQVWQRGAAFFPAEKSLRERLANR